MPRQESIDVRAATASDLPAILDIYNFEIVTGYAHFGVEPMSLASIEEQFQQAGNLPWFVAVDGDALVGFARASAWKTRGAYAQTCEVGVYVRPETQGRGIGRRIYEEFIPELRTRRFKTLLAGVALPNPASVRLHESFGFRKVGELPSVGWKHGAWRNVGYWALTFDDVDPATG